MTGKIVCKAAVTIGFAAVLAYGADIYISPAGNDANNGTIDAPLKTIAAARDKADQLKATNPPVTVYLRGGTYYLTEPLVFGPKNSGTATAPIVYTAYCKGNQAEKPVISGGIKVTSSWSQHSGQILVTTIAKDLKVDQLFLNGKRQILARFPNYDSTKILDGYSGSCLNNASKWASPAEGPGYHRCLHDAMWGSNNYIITGKDGSSITRKWVGDNDRGSQTHNSYQMVENIFEELDAAGEWFYRKSTGQLFFHPLAGTDLAASTIELASLDELIQIQGTSMTEKTQYITFQGITFTHTFRTLFTPHSPHKLDKSNTLSLYEPLLRGDWRIARAGAIFMINAEHIRIRHCFFDQIGGNGIFMSSYNRKHVVYNNKFEHAGASCVAICGPMTAVRCPRTNTADYEPNCSDKTPGPKNEDYPAEILVENNTMYNFGRFEKQTAGVNMSMTRRDTIRHNTIYKMPRAGINCTDGCWGGHVIENNWVYQSVLETGDHGPFNAWGRDRISRWPDEVSASKLDAMETTIIRNNRFEGKTPYFGIDLDDQASNYLQYNNLCVRVGLKLQWNRFNTYVNNILVDGAMVEVHSIWSNTNHYLARNILYGPVAYSMGGYTQTSQLPSIKANVTLIDSNCVYNNGPEPYIARWNHPDEKVFTWSQWRGAGLDAHSVMKDPMFVDPAKGDYRVKDGSPALALGFKNFPMDQFGARNIPWPDGSAIDLPSSTATVPAVPMLRYQSGRLVFSGGGDYRLKLLTASGRTVRVLNGKGASNASFVPGVGGAGVYFAVIRANGRMETLRFVAN